jgi:predicted porin
MNRKLLLLSAACIMASNASAQSSVTLYGRVDLGLGRAVGANTVTEQEMTPGDSRFGLMGVEDLGGGNRALFNLENRFRANTGDVPTRFWQGTSTVGLEGGWGMVNLGWQYTPSYSLIENTIDPFGGVTVANLRDVGMRPGASIFGFSGSPSGTNTVSQIHVANSIRYDLSKSGFNFAALVADHTQPTPGPRRPKSVAANYTFGPLFVGVGYEDPQGLNDREWKVGARYKIGKVLLAAGYARGRTETNLTARGFLLGVTVHAGPGEFKAGYAASKVGTNAANVERRRVGVGYEYHLSKRTSLYTDVAHEQEISTNKTGFDLGIKHLF